MTTTEVSDLNSLISAVSGSSSGRKVVLAPGRYLLNKTIEIHENTSLYLYGCTLERTTPEGFVLVARSHVNIFGGKIVTPNAFDPPPTPRKLEADLSIRADDVYVESIDISNTGGMYPRRADYNYHDPDSVEKQDESGRVQACIQIWGIEDVKRIHHITLRNCRCQRTSHCHLYQLGWCDDVTIENCTAAGELGRFRADGSSIPSWDPTDSDFFFAPFTQDGFRGYPESNNVTIKGCTAIRCRVGFQSNMNHGEHPNSNWLFENCQAYECCNNYTGAFSLSHSSNPHIVNCHAAANYTRAALEVGGTVIFTDAARPFTVDAFVCWNNDHTKYLHGLEGNALDLMPWAEVLIDGVGCNVRGITGRSQFPGDRSSPNSRQGVFICGSNNVVIDNEIVGIDGHTLNTRCSRGNFRNDRTSEGDNLDTHIFCDRRF